MQTSNHQITFTRLSSLESRVTKRLLSRCKDLTKKERLEISKPGTAKREESRHSTVMNALAAGIVVDGNHLLDNVSLLTLNDVEENENN